MRSQSQVSNLQRFMSCQPIRVLAVCSGKGGVGKTNVAVNVAVAMAAQKRKVCLLDADVSLANVDVLLGLQPKYNLSHVASGEVPLSETLLAGPSDLSVIPASSGNFQMTDLPSVSQAAVIQAFSDLDRQPDVLVVDTSAGIAPTVARFVQAAQHAVVVVRDEPASLTDAYALIKVFSQNYGISRFQVITNQSPNAYAGRILFSKLQRVTDSYLDVALNHLGDVPQDSYLVKAVQEQRAVVDAYPRSPAGRAFRKIAERTFALPTEQKSNGGIEFFIERMMLADQKGRGLVA
ncbi:MAG: P-loop NTPase [Woeseiaceae bacterium]